MAVHIFSRCQRAMLRMIKKCAIAASVVAMVAVVPTNAKSQKRPNIVIILADDMGFSDFGSYGGEIPTPNIDALAHDGVRFTQFYNNARCSPSRAALLTGLNPHQAGMGHLAGTKVAGSRGVLSRLHERSVTIPELLRQNGYFTAMAGKWHLGTTDGTTPWTRGFQRSLSMPAGGVYFPAQADGKILLIDGQRYELSDPIFGQDWYGTDLWTDWGIKFIEEARAEKRPFFLYLSHVAPHFPLMAPQADIDRFLGTYRAGWDVLRHQRFARQQAMGIIDAKARLSAPNPAATRWSQLSSADQNYFDELMAIYAASVSRLDQSVGRLTGYLRDNGLLDNTVILIMSDNGGNGERGPRGQAEGERPLGGPGSNVFTGMNWAQLQNAPFRNFKHHTHEGDIASPLIVHWPNGMDAKRAKALVHMPAHMIDIMPTVLDLTGTKYPRQFAGHQILPMEGISLRSTLAGHASERGKPLFWMHEGNRAIRDGKWKAVMRFRGQWELYDMNHDRTEQQDLAALQPARVKALSGKWQKWADRTFVWAFHNAHARGAACGADVGCQIRRWTLGNKL